MSADNKTIEVRHRRGIVFMAMLIMNIDQINAQRLVDQMLPPPPMGKYRHIKMVILEDLLKQMMDLGFQVHVSLVRDFLAALYLVDNSTPCCPHCGYLPIENQDGIWKISEICVNPGCLRHIGKVGLVGPKRKPRRIVSVISNSRNDLPYLSMVQAAVQPLIDQGEVASFWDNSQVERGVDVDLKWQEADTILLLMSPELLARLYLYNWLERVSAVLEQEGKEVIMLLLRPCSWKYAPVICDLKALLEEKAAVSTIGKDKAMEALVQALLRGVSI